MRVQRRAEGAGDRRGVRAARAGRARREARCVPVRAVGRAAAARRHRARARPEARPAALRRADERARPRARRRGAVGDQGARRRGLDDGRRHPRARLRARRPPTRCCSWTAASSWSAVRRATSSRSRPRSARAGSSTGSCGRSTERRPGAPAAASGQGVALAHGRPQPRSLRSGHAGAGAASGCSACSSPCSRSIALIGNFQYVLGFRFFATANFFSYFTVQSAMLAVVTLGIAGRVRAARRRATRRGSASCARWSPSTCSSRASSSGSSSRRRRPATTASTCRGRTRCCTSSCRRSPWSRGRPTASSAVNPRVPWSTVGWVLVYPSLWLAVHPPARRRRRLVPVLLPRRGAGRRSASGVVALLRARARDLRGDHGGARRRQPGAVA